MQYHSDIVAEILVKNLKLLTLIIHDTEVLLYTKIYIPLHVCSPCMWYGPFQLHALFRPGPLNMCAVSTLDSTTVDLLFVKYG